MGTNDNHINIESLKIVHVSFSDNVGGAAKAAYRIHDKMLEYGLNSNMLVVHKTIETSTIYSFSNLIYLSYRFFYSIISRFKRFFLNYSYYHSCGFSLFFLKNNKILKDADVIYIHWCNNGFFSIKDIAFFLKQNKLVIIYMHDMWAITGGCHHSFECLKYKRQCINCKNINNHFFTFIPFKIQKMKLRKWKNFNNLRVIAPSKWLANCAKESSVFKFNKVYNIPNILDTLNTFCLKNKVECRVKYSLPIDKKLILFGSANAFSNKYKGWYYLKEALSYLKRNDCAIVFIGEDMDDDYFRDINISYFNLGFIDSDYNLSLVYNACDVFVLPSLAENFPNSIVEAMCCNLPVVGFDVGGIPELISHKKNGYIVQYKDSIDLAKGVNWVLDNLLMKDNIEHEIFTHFESDNIIKQHERIIEEYFNDIKI